MHEVEYNSELTFEDRDLIDMILIGVCKYVKQVSGLDAERYADGVQKESPNNRAFTAMLFNVDNIMNGRSAFRPVQLRDTLPDELRGIKRTQLMDNIQVLEDLGVIMRVANEKIKSTSRRTTNGDEIPGPKVYLEPTKADELLGITLSKVKALGHILAFLNGSSLLLAYFQFVNRVVLYTIRNRSKPEAIDVIMSSRKICKFPALAGSEIDVIWEQLQSDKVNYHAAVERLASQMAQNDVENIDEEGISVLSRFGFYYFAAKL
jgi:hypothetical protein